MDKRAADAFHSEVSKLVRDLAAKHGLKVSKLSGSYNDLGMKMSIELGDTAKIGDGHLPWIKGLKKEGWRYGLTEADLNKEVMRHGRAFTIAGMNKPHSVVLKDKNPANPKKPYIALDPNDVLVMLGRTPKNAALV